jgi:flavin reductase (DIM6/NTAB) family NADH-FMN oxidoreductase RutF
MGMHRDIELKVPYFGTPVVLISTVNEDGSANLMPMSSAWWLGDSTVVGVGDTSKTSGNLLRERECVLNLVPSGVVAAVDRLALLTGVRDVPAYKVARGYRHEKDKFGAAGLTAQPSDLVRAPRIAECPIQLEGEVVGTLPLADGGATAFEVRTLKAHIDESVLIPGTEYVDPVGWDPLIMKFCEFFGDGRNLHESRLAGGWQMPHRGRLSA